jgi:alpha/beta superfamily hydrolase
VQRTLLASSKSTDFVERTTLIDSTDGVSLEVAVTPGSTRVDVAALICHPWGRLGGSMRDSVVVSLRNVLSAEGFTVCRWQ